MTFVRSETGPLPWIAESRNERNREPRALIHPKPYAWRGQWTNPVLDAMTVGTPYEVAVKLAPFVSDKNTH